MAEIIFPQNAINKICYFTVSYNVINKTTSEFINADFFNQYFILFFDKLIIPFRIRLSFPANFKQTAIKGSDWFSRKRKFKSVNNRAKISKQKETHILEKRSLVPVLMITIPSDDNAI